MKPLRSISLILLTSISFSGSVFSQEPESAPPEPENDRWIVQFQGEPSENEIESLLSHTGGQSIKRLPLIHGRAVRGPESMVAALRTSILVKRVEKDVIRKATAKPAPGETIPWGVKRIYADQAWTSTCCTGRGVKVAVLDTGISKSHPDLMANIKGGFNAVRDLNEIPEDLNGHGSHVAGTIAAIHNNSIGVAGVAPNAELYAVQVLTASGWGYCSDIIQGLGWIIDKGIKVANMSYGGSEPCDGESKALDEADAKGITLVAAAGNNSGGAVDWPGAHGKVIAVTAVGQATGDALYFASFSSQGSEVDLTAPGVSIPSTYKKAGYKTLSGTSMASPHVAGTAALVLQKHPTLKPDQVKSCLQTTAENLSLSSEQQGAGLVDAEKAITCH